MKKEAKDKHFIKKPIYEGGPKAMRKFIGENLSYPKEALENRLEGTVIVKYDIDYTGKVTDARVISGIGHGCDEEAIRLAKLLKFKVPKSRGVRVLFHKTIRINFRLPKQEKPEPTSLQITYTSAPSKKSEKPKSSSGGYTYTLPIG